MTKREKNKTIFLQIMDLVAQLELKEDATQDGFLILYAENEKHHAAPSEILLTGATDGCACTLHTMLEKMALAHPQFSKILKSVGYKVSSGGAPAADLFKALTGLTENLKISAIKHDQKN